MTATRKDCWQRSINQCWSRCVRAGNERCPKQTGNYPTVCVPHCPGCEDCHGCDCTWNPPGESAIRFSYQVSHFQLVLCTLQLCLSVSVLHHFRSTSSSLAPFARKRQNSSLAAFYCDVLGNDNYMLHETLNEEHYCYTSLVMDNREKIIRTGVDHGARSPAREEREVTRRVRGDLFSP